MKEFNKICFKIYLEFIIHAQKDKTKKFFVFFILLSCVHCHTMEGGKFISEEGCLLRLTHDDDHER